MVLSNNRKKTKANGIPSWIVVEPEKDNAARMIPRTNSSSAAGGSSHCNYHKKRTSLDRNEIFQEILDGRSSFHESMTSTSGKPNNNNNSTVAPLLTCLSSKSSSSTDYDQNDDNHTHDYGDILTDLQRDSRLEWKLPDRLKFGVLQVADASVSGVNGVYRCTGTVDGVGRYDKRGDYDKEATKRRLARRKVRSVVFSVFRCLHADNTSRWYLSICSPHHEPGTKHDTDLYAALATGDAMEVPPCTGWRVVVGSGVEGNPPMTKWIPPQSQQKSSQSQSFRSVSAAVPQPCIECGYRPVSHVLVPCGHACLCRACANALVRNKRACPVQQCHIQSAIRLQTTSSNNMTASCEEDESLPLPNDGPQVLADAVSGVRRLML